MNNSGEETIGTALVDLLLNSATYRKGLDEAEKLTGTSAKRMEKSLSGVDDVLALLSTKFLTLAKVATAAFSVHAIYEYGKEAALLSARIETMSVVLGVVGKNAGYASGNMKEFVMGVKGMGITTDAAMTSVTQMAQAQLDLSKATGLARVAQDAAVVGNTNSSDAFSRLVYGIKTGQMEVLRTIGINVSFEQSYARFAATIHKTASSLNENEKMQARLNAVLTEGSKLQGVYEESMKTTGKLILSMPRYLEDFKERVGQAFSPALGVLVRSFIDVLQDLTKELTKLRDSGDLGVFANNIRGAVKFMIDGFRDLWKVISKVDDFLTKYGKVIGAGLIPIGATAMLVPGGQAFGAAAMAGGASFLAMEDKGKFNAEDERVRIKARMEQVSFAPLPGRTEEEVRKKLTQDYLKSREAGYALTFGDLKQIKAQTEESFKATKLLTDFQNIYNEAIKKGEKEKAGIYKDAIGLMQQRFALGKAEQKDAEKQQEVLKKQREQADKELHAKEVNTAISASAIDVLKTKNKEFMDVEKSRHELSLNLLKQENFERKDYAQESYDFVVKMALKEAEQEVLIAAKMRDKKITDKGAWFAPAAQAEYNTKLKSIQEKAQADIDKALVDLEKSRFEILKKQYEDNRDSYAKYMQEKVDLTEEGMNVIANAQKDFEANILSRAMREIDIQKSLLDIEEIRGATIRDTLPKRKDAAEQAVKLAEAEVRWLQWFKGNPLFEDRRLTAIQGLIKAQTDLANITKTEQGYTLAGAWGQQFKTLREEWENTAKSMADVGIRAFRGISDALTEFVMGGKLDFNSLANSIIRDLIRIQIQESLVRSFSSINWGGMWANITGNPAYGMNVGTTELPVGHAGGDLSLGGVPTRSVPNNLLLGVPRLHEGLNPDEFVAILQRGEKVTPKGKNASGNVQINVINQSSQPVVAQQGPVRFDGDKMVTSVILRDLQSNGPIRQSLRAGGLG